jgi:hypothetical protein
MHDYQDMDNCLCGDDCTGMDNWGELQYTEIEFGTDAVYRPMGETVETGGSGDWFPCGEDTDYSDGCQLVASKTSYCCARPSNPARQVPLGHARVDRDVLWLVGRQYAGHLQWRLRLRHLLPYR